MTRWHWAALAVLIPVLVVGAIMISRDLAGTSGGTTVEFANAADEVDFEHDYVIPAGTADRIAAGEVVELVPAVLEVEVGDAIRIVNDDDEGHVVGVFYVGPGETLTKRFMAPGELTGACALHSGGEFTVLVRA